MENVETPMMDITNNNSAIVMTTVNNFNPFEFSCTVINELRDRGVPLQHAEDAAQRTWGEITKNGGSYDYLSGKAVLPAGIARMGRRNASIGNEFFGLNDNNEAAAALLVSPPIITDVHTLMDNYQANGVDANLVDDFVSFSSAQDSLLVNPISN
jgi:uncharacterized protein YkvS